MVIYDVIEEVLIKELLENVNLVRGFNISGQNLDYIKGQLTRFNYKFYVLKTFFDLIQM